MNKKIADMITERILAKMEQGQIPWRKPWAGSKGAVSHITGKPYSLLNQILLDFGGEYITYKQAQAEGGQVKKGAKGIPVVFWKQYEKKDEETGEIEYIPVLRYYTVFNINDVDGIEPKHEPETPVKHANPVDYAEQIIKYYQTRENITIHREEPSSRAFYRPATDEITVPRMEQFADTAEYYSVVFHEMTHSTGAANRLNRKFGKKYSFGADDNYSKEELVAEIGAASLVNHCNLETDESFTNSAAYIQGWSKALKEDTTLIIAAAGKAEKAYQFVLDGFEPEEGPEPNPEPSDTKPEQNQEPEQKQSFDYSQPITWRGKKEPIYIIGIFDKNGKPSLQQVQAYTALINSRHGLVKLAIHNETYSNKIWTVTSCRTGLRLSNCGYNTLKAAKADVPNILKMLDDFRDKRPNEYDKCIDRMDKLQTATIK